MSTQTAARQLKLGLVMTIVMSFAAGVMALAVFEEALRGKAAVLHLTVTLLMLGAVVLNARRLCRLIP
jgi:hypothetical protein